MNSQFSICECDVILNQGIKVIASSVLSQPLILSLKKKEIHMAEEDNAETEAAVFVRGGSGAGDPKAALSVGANWQVIFHHR